MPWQRDDGRFYDSNMDPDDLIKSGNSIKIIHEMSDIEDDLEFEKAHSILKEAKKIYFLGFGYDRTNVERLLHPFYFQGNKPKRITTPITTKDFEITEKYLSDKDIAGTAFNLEDGERERTMDLFWGYTFDIELKTKNVDSLLFLRQLNL